MPNFPDRVQAREIDSLRPYPANARTHSKKRLRQLAASIREFGFTAPVLVTEDNMIVAGHGRVEAARLAGWREIPVISLAHLTPEQAKAYVIADNRLAELAVWDQSILATEFVGLIDFSFDLEITGFETADVDAIIAGAVAANPAAKIDRDNEIPELAEVALINAHGFDAGQEEL